VKQINSNENLILGNQVSFNNSIDVYCAWCNQFLYVSNGFYKKEHKVSHGICKSCAEKVFKVF